MENKEKIPVPDISYPVLVRVKRFGDAEIKKEDAIKAAEGHPVDHEKLADKILKWGSMFVLLPGWGAGSAAAKIGGSKSLIPIEDIGPVHESPYESLSVPNDTLPIDGYKVDMHGFDNPLFEEDTYAIDLTQQDPIFTNNSLRTIYEMGRFRAEGRPAREAKLNVAPRKPVPRPKPVEIELKELLPPPEKPPLEGIDNPGFEMDEEIEPLPDQIIPMREPEPDKFDESFLQAGGKKESTPIGRKPKRGNVIELQDLGGGQYVTKFEKLSETRFQEEGFRTRRGQKLRDITIGNIDIIETIPEETEEMIEMDDLNTAFLGEPDIEIEDEGPIYFLDNNRIDPEFARAKEYVTLTERGEPVPTAETTRLSTKTLKPSKRHSSTVSLRETILGPSSVYPKPIPVIPGSRKRRINEEQILITKKKKKKKRKHKIFLFL